MRIQVGEIWMFTGHSKCRGEHWKVIDTVSDNSGLILAVNVVDAKCSQHCRGAEANVSIRLYNTYWELVSDPFDTWVAECRDEMPCPSEVTVRLYDPHSRNLTQIKAEDFMAAVEQKVIVMMPQQPEIQDVVWEVLCDYLASQENEE